jgi:hypothetical protein
MNKKYQKPISRNLGDLAPAEGACNFGWFVAGACSTGSNHTLCSLGGEFGQASCPTVGRSASSCDPTGITALP